MSQYWQREIERERDEWKRRAEQAEARVRSATRSHQFTLDQKFELERRAEQAEAAQRNLEEREEKLEEALEQAETALENAHSRLETIYESRDPERMTQEAYFGMLEADRFLELLEADRFLELLAPPEEKQPYTEDDHEGGFVQ